MLNPEQQKQTARQIEAYEREASARVVSVPFGEKALELNVEQFVANPEIMNSGIQVVEYLQKNPDLVKGRVVTDMGTGCGIIGIASGLLGAQEVLMPDVDERAVKNALENIERLNMGGVCETFQSDLFNNFAGKPKSDVQIFNHPFFSVPPVEGKEWTRMMFGGTGLIARYFEEAPHFSSEDAIYILPWLTIAGHEGAEVDNDPGKRALDFGYKIITITEQAPVKQGLQQSSFKIYTLKR